MMEKLTKHREGYLNQLNEVEASLQELDRKRDRYMAQREQLKGAIFALDMISNPDAEDLSNEVVEG